MVRSTIDAPRIAVVRALPGLGDLLCAVPALRALRMAMPTGHITLIGLAGARWAVERFDRYLDDHLACPTWPGLAEIDGDRLAAEPFLACARQRRFDLAIQMHGDGRASNALTAALGARWWTGLIGTEAPAVPRGCTVAPYVRNRHEVDRCLDAVALAGAPRVGTYLEFPIRATDRDAAAALVPSTATIAVVHPGASTASRRWSPVGFGRVVQRLLADVDLVVMSGGRSDRDVITAALANVDDRRRVLNLGGRTSIGALAAVLARADVVVANDTGVAHLASAVCAPTVTVCGPDNTGHWTPRSASDLTIGGASHRRWPTVREVGRAIDRLATVYRRGSP